jgi:hypothetical protein
MLPPFPEGLEESCTRAAVADSLITFAGAVAEHVNPAQDAAMLPNRARLPFEKGVGQPLDALSRDSS